MVILASEKWASDQSQVLNEIYISDNNSMGFCICDVGACQSEWKWMSAVFAGCIQL